MSWYKKLLGILFPEHCVGCGTQGFLICERCIHKLSPASSPEHDFIMSIFGYGNPSVRRLVHMLKYENGRHVAQFFAPYLASSLTEFLGEEKLFHGDVDVLLVPVPLSKNRMKKRGYNQSELLIREMIKNLSDDKFFLENKLASKIRDTIPQVEIKKRSTRLLNQDTCFCILPHKRKKNEIVILVDDVTTTGATLSALRQLLKKDGFTKVYALTIAH